MGQIGFDYLAALVCAALVEEQLAIASAIALGADIVQPFEQRHQPAEVFETKDVAIANLAGFQCRYPAMYA